MKPRFVNGKAIKNFFNNSDKQVSKDVINAVDNVVHQVLAKSLSATRSFKRVTEAEINLVSASLIR